MKISPEPLSPLDSWRELWQAKPANAQRTQAGNSDSQSRENKSSKRVSFHWLNHILNRDISR